MTNFSSAFVARWKHGQMEPALDCPQIVVVDYDQTKTAYEVRPSEMKDFIEWVAANWEQDSDPREMNDEGDYTETAQEYLDRIWCSVSVK